MIPIPLDPNIIAALVTLGLKEGSIVTKADVKAAYRAAAKSAHPDAGGNDEEMKKLNAAYELVLAWLEKCLCLGFTRNPMCRAHDDEPADGACSECGGTKKVEVGTWSKVKIDCPKCS